MILNYNFKLFFLLINASFYLIGCYSYKDKNIYISNQLTYPIAIDYYAYNIKYFETNKKYSQKDKKAFMYYKPLYCKKCEINYKGDNFVSIILQPQDTVAISGSLDQIYYRNDILVIGETRIYPADLRYNKPSGFALLNYLKPFGINTILSVDNSNIDAICYPDTFNYPCKLIEFKDSTNANYDNYEFCRLPNDTICMSYTGRWEYKGKGLLEYEKRYYYKQRELSNKRSYLLKSQ